MATHRVLVTDHPWPGLEIEQRRLAPFGVELIDAPAADEATLSRLAADVEAIATCWAQVTAKVIESARECRVICRLGIGLDNIDIPTATAHGIPVTNIPDYCVEEVADHALSQLLSLSRNLPFFHLRTKRGEYDLKSGPPMHRLRGRTLGLIGLGRIGQAVFTRARAFGLNVMAFTPSGNDHGTGCRMVELAELYRTSDLISIHAPLSPATRHLVDREAFALMRPGVLLANTSRGPLIDVDALWEAIQSGQVMGAALDVFEPEPPDLALPLYRSEKTLITPHAAFVSEESVVELRERVCGQILAVLSGETPENIVNREVLG